ncbi:ATP-dependent zinc metalloprotease FtsH [Lachnospira pectinoschiza]|uniref:ATP-dependent zinc metalloprotease FtsH n=1 Tax=Lachnospira pectinoschiza TaxID=28052 RepID=UPI001D0661DA|nr:ATP-dependent zinc metalloprotease FtsH [Lachnospira pectinoschiza]MCB6142859.1 ATP-dependent zinc metalloprotease FtsH [Lachnospira pectinoschiza]
MNTNRNKMGGVGIYLVVIAVIAVLYFALARLSPSSSSYSYSNFLWDVQNGYVSSVLIKQNSEVPTGVLSITKTDNGEELLNVSDVHEIEQLLLDNNIRYTLKDVTRDSVWITTILPFGICLVIIIVIMMMTNRQAGGGGGAKMMNFGKSRAKLMNGTQNSVTFKDVAGLQEEKEELEEIVDFLKNPVKYTELGARIPKGVILTGPPGTGKTLLAKAVAGEAGVPFFNISGSDFVEMFVGVGASRVRDLFEEAKKNAPCIVFIDEIDAVARRRGTGMGGGHDEREQTLNQMLVEMDGFGINEGIIVMAATNRIDILDPAILRPGRFDRKVVVGRPDVQGRLEILNVHAAKKPLGDDVDLESLARTTAGFTGADLENLLNEAAINAAKRKEKYITNADVNYAFVKVGIGVEKRSKIISEKEKKITAYHESGHAILFHLLPDVGPVHTISIIPTGMGAAGYTMPLPERDEMFNTRGKMLQNIIVSLGGRIAEELVFDDITTGASQDIKQATETARSMVTKYGFSSKLGLINYDNDSDEVFIGRDLAHTRPYGEEVASQIDTEVKNIIDECYGKAKKMIEEHMDVLEKSAQLLLEKEKVTREEFEALFEN